MAEQARVGYYDQQGQFKQVEMFAEDSVASNDVNADEHITDDSKHLSDIITPGVYFGKFTIDKEGRVTDVTPIQAVELPNIPWTQIEDTPDNLSGYGIKDAVNKTGDNMTGQLTVTAKTSDYASGAINAIAAPESTDLGNYPIAMKSKDGAHGYITLDDNHIGLEGQGTDYTKPGNYRAELRLYNNLPPGWDLSSLLTLLRTNNAGQQMIYKLFGEHNPDPLGFRIRGNIETGAFTQIANMSPGYYRIFVAVTGMAIDGKNWNVIWTKSDIDGYGLLIASVLGMAGAMYYNFIVGGIWQGWQRILDSFNMPIESGVWTPSFVAGGAYSLHTGNYLRLNNFVILDGRITLSNTDGLDPSNIIGLPFAPANDNPVLFNGFSRFLTFPSGFMYWMPIGTMANAIRMDVQTNNQTTVTLIPASAFAANTDFRFTCAYRILT